MFPSSSLVISKPASVNRRGLIFSAIKQFSIRSAYRRRLSASVITPAATTTITMTVASASIEARVSYQLFQSSSMRWSLSKARPALRKFHCVERTCLCGQKCNATFRRARFDRAATWLGGMVVGEEAPARRRLVSLLTKYLSNGATNPIHARYYCGGNICLKCALEHTRRQRPRPLQPARRGRLVRDQPSKRTT